MHGDTCIERKKETVLKSNKCYIHGAEAVDCLLLPSELGCKACQNDHLICRNRKRTVQKCDLFRENLVFL